MQVTIFFPFLNILWDHPWRTGGHPAGRAVSSSLSGAYLQNYPSYGYELLWVDRSHQGGEKIFVEDRSKY